MAPVPDSVLMCLAVSYSESRSSEWWQKMSGGVEGRSHTHRHGWRVLWRHREERIKTHVFATKFSLVNRLVISLLLKSVMLICFDCSFTALYLWLHQKTITVTNSAVMLAEEKNRQEGRLTFSLWKEWRKFPLSSPSSLGVPGGLLMPLKLFGEFWKQRVHNVVVFLCITLDVIQD